MLRIVSTVSLFPGLPELEKVGHADEFIMLHRIHREPREEQLCQPENVTKTVELSEAGMLQCQELKKSSCCRGKIIIF